MKCEITSIDFGEWIREKRKAAKLSQSDLADKAHCHMTSIGRWERGEAWPTLDEAETIARIFKAELVIREKGNERERET